jgi:anti-anti-sigma factor
MEFQNDHVTLEAAPDCAVIQFLGDLDMNVMMQVRPALEPLLAEIRTPIFVDLSKVEFLDSSAVNLLALVFQTVRKNHQSMAIVGAGDQPAAVIEMVGLSDYVPMVADLTEAKAALKIRA